MFQKFRNLKLRTKLLISICSVVWLAFAVTIFYIGYNARNLAEKEALDKARESAYRYANLVQAELGNPWTWPEPSPSFEGMKQQGVPPRDMMDGVLKQVLEENPGFLAVWTCWEPNAWTARTPICRCLRPRRNGPLCALLESPDGGDRCGAAGRLYDPKKGAYYQILGVRQEVVFDPVPFTVGEQTQLKTVLTVPVRFDGKLLPWWVSTYPVSTFTPLVKQIKLFETGYGFLIANNGVFVAHPTKQANVGKHMDFFAFDKKVIQDVKAGRETSQYKVSKTTGKKTYYILAPIPIGWPRRSGAWPSTFPSTR
jgi:methyl-accepting chemotaxis protein